MFGGSELYLIKKYIFKHTGTLQKGWVLKMLYCTNFDFKNSTGKIVVCKFEFQTEKIKRLDKNGRCFYPFWTSFIWSLAVADRLTLFRGRFSTKFAWAGFIVVVVDRLSLFGGGRQRRPDCILLSEIHKNIILIVF